MRCNIFRIWPAALLLLFSLPACTNIMSPELSSRSRNIAFNEVLSDPQKYVGTTVIWGGVIIRTYNYPDRTEIIALQAPLAYGEMPGKAEDSEGRFLAKVSHYLDPAVYRPGRRITVGGQINGRELRPINMLLYSYPVLSVKEVHLWASNGGGILFPNWEW